MNKKTTMGLLIALLLTAYRAEALMGSIDAENPCWGTALAHATISHPVLASAWSQGDRRTVDFSMGHSLNLHASAGSCGSDARIYIDNELLREMGYVRVKTLAGNPGLLPVGQEGAYLAAERHSVTDPAKIAELIVTFARRIVQEDPGLRMASASIERRRAAARAALDDKTRAELDSLDRVARMGGGGF